MISIRSGGDDCVRIRCDRDEALRFGIALLEGVHAKGLSEAVGDCPSGILDDFIQVLCDRDGLLRAAHFGRVWDDMVSPFASVALGVDGGMVDLSMSRGDARRLARVLRDGGEGTRLDRSGRAEYYLRTGLAQSRVLDLADRLEAPAPGGEVVLPWGVELIEAPPRPRVRQSVYLRQSRESSLRLVGMLSESLWAGDIDSQYFLRLLDCLVVSVREQEGDSVAAELRGLWHGLAGSLEACLSGGTSARDRGGEVGTILDRFREVLEEAVAAMPPSTGCVGV